jgi:hypothetical protein
LVIGQGAVVDVLRLQAPFQVKAGGVGIFVFDPASLFELLLEPAVASGDDEHFLIFLQVMLLFPSLKISDVRKDLELGHVSFHESFQIGLDESLFLFCRLELVIWLTSVVWGLQAVLIGRFLGSSAPCSATLFGALRLVGDLFKIGLHLLSCFDQCLLVFPFLLLLLSFFLILLGLQLSKHFLLLLAHLLGPFLSFTSFLQLQLLVLFVKNSGVTS